MKLLLAVALFPTVAMAGSDLSTVKSPELCVQFAMNLAKPNSTYPVTQDELMEELVKRGERCAPNDLYSFAAGERLRQLDTIEKDALAEAEIDEIRRQERKSRFIRALQNISNPPTQQRTGPRTITCRPDGIGGTTCTTW